MCILKYPEFSLMSVDHDYMIDVKWWHLQSATQIQCFQANVHTVGSSATPACHGSAASNPQRLVLCSSGLFLWSNPWWPNQKYETPVSTVHRCHFPTRTTTKSQCDIRNQDSFFFKSTIFVQDQKLYRLPLVVNIASMGAVGSRWDIRTIKPGFCAAAASTNFCLGSHTGHTELTSSVQKPVPCDQF